MNKKFEFDFSRFGCSADTVMDYTQELLRCINEQPPIHVTIVNKPIFMVGDTVFVKDVEPGVVTDIRLWPEPCRASKVRIERTGKEWWYENSLLSRRKS